LQLERRDSDACRIISLEKNYRGVFIMELSIIDKKLAMDSRDIAKLTKKSHSHVLRDIKSMIEKLDSDKSKNGTSYNIRTYQNANNVSASYYLLDYELTMILLTGYSVELRSAVVKRWLSLERHYQTERKKYCVQ
jgi:phage regulator Rha-like protein